MFTKLYLSGQIYIEVVVICVRIFVQFSLALLDFDASLVNKNDKICPPSNCASQEATDNA